MAYVTKSAVVVTVTIAPPAPPVALRPNPSYADEPLVGNTIARTMIHLRVVSGEKQVVGMVMVIVLLGQWSFTVVGDSALLQSA